MSLSLLGVALILGAILLALYIYGTWTFGHFTKRGVPHLDPKPLLGDLWRSIFRMENIVHSVTRAYKKYPEHRYVGFFNMRLPSLIIRDPDLIRQIAIKDFDHFTDRQQLVDDSVDPLLSSNLVSLKGQKWRDMRATLSPAFTGSKMRNMYTLVSDCAQQMANHLKKETQEIGHKDFELKSLFTVYTNDVIATSAFGIKVDSLENPDNDFYKMGKKMSNLGGVKFVLIFLGYILMPKIMKMLRIKLIDSQCASFFRELVHGTIAIREKEGIVRPDMIHLLMQTRQGSLQHDASTQQKDAGFATVTESDLDLKQPQKRAWTDDELTGQALIFFLAGFETVANALSFTFHELAVNHDVQQKLQEEIDELRAENESPNYEIINRMKYLDMVVTESLRMWPPAAGVDRVCIKPYSLEDHQGNKYQLKEGDSVAFPIYQLQHDEKYYDNPEKFDPERFNDENKKNIQPFTYMPFGVGPRNCIGSRFALMEVKAILFHILSHFNLEPCEKTEIPLTITRKSFVMAPENGFWLSFVARDK